jgi:hypothetical protein
MASSMNMTAFWDIGPYSLVEAGRRFRGVSNIKAMTAPLIVCVSMYYVNLVSRKCTGVYMYMLLTLVNINVTLKSEQMLCSF